MGNSVRENILDNIETTLQGITVANGYNYTFTAETVQRWKQHGNNFVDVPCIVINAAPEEKAPGPDPYLTCRLTVHIDVWTRQIESDNTPTDKIINKLLADVEKALMADHTRGGSARETNLVGNVPFEAVDGSHVGIIVDIEIVYQHLRTNPETAG